MYEKDFEYFKASYKESMQEMFAAVSNLYAKYWNDFFHFALFDNDNQSFEDAFRKTHKKYMNDLGISNAHNILELACGRGGFTNILAQNTKGNVLGIDISKSQLSHAKKYKQHNLKFKQHDIMGIDELNQKFDAIVYLDAACYLPDKKLALEKISKIMNKHARLLIVDWCKKENLTKMQEDLVLHPFMKYWAIPNLETPKNYQKYFKRTGFKIIKIEYLNAKVRKNWEYGYLSSIKAIKEISIKDLSSIVWSKIKYGTKSVKIIKEQFPAALYIKAGYDAGFLRYAYFLVEKK